MSWENIPNASMMVFSSSVSGTVSGRDVDATVKEGSEVRIWGVMDEGGCKISVLKRGWDSSETVFCNVSKACSRLRIRTHRLSIWSWSSSVLARTMRFPRPGVSAPVSTVVIFLFWHEKAFNQPSGQIDAHPREMHFSQGTYRWKMEKI